MGFSNQDQNPDFLTPYLVYPSSHGTHVCCVASVISDSLQPYGLQSSRLLCPQDSPGKNTGVAAISSSRGSSRPRDQTCISCLLHWQVGSLPLVPPGKPLPWYSSHLYSYYIVRSILFQRNNTFLPKTGCIKVHQEDVPITLIFLNQDLKTPCRVEMMSLWIARSSENCLCSSPRGPQIYHKPTGQLCTQRIKLPRPHIFSNKPSSLFCKTYK